MNYTLCWSQKQKQIHLFIFLFTKTILRSKIWLLSCSHNPNLTLLNNHIQNISRCLDFYLSKYNNSIVLRNFNIETLNTTISVLCVTSSLKNLIKETKYFKSLENPTCIHLILRNQSKCFQNSNVFETGLSDLDYPIRISF